MKLFLSAICLLLVSCGATDLSGTYVCNEVFFSSQTMNPTEISENQNAAQSDLIGSSIIVVQYDDFVWIGFSETDGNHFKQISNNEYIFHQDNGDKVIASFSKEELTLKETDSQYTIKIVCNKQ
ncbi:hypothetical protein [uncultured Alistipes sp.]|uniref:hypothetical protein n=1 Tax=uncultured Alistipes sp. TaxID=538949 RepID=UPI00260FB1F5|nr:hypothetical protein [uncultured Alistipes sp.]